MSAEIIEGSFDGREQNEPRTSEYILQRVFAHSGAETYVEQLRRSGDEVATRRLLALTLSMYEADSADTQPGLENQLIKKVAQQCVFDDSDEAIHNMLEQEGLGQVAPAHVIIEAAAKNITERLHSWIQPVMHQGGTQLHDTQEVLGRMSWLYLRMTEQIDFGKDELTGQLLRLYSRPAGSDRSDHELRVRCLQMHFSDAAYGPRIFIDTVPLREALGSMRQMYIKRRESFPGIVATDEDLLVQALLGGGDTVTETPQSFLEVAGHLGLSEQEIVTVRAGLLAQVQALMAARTRRGGLKKQSPASKTVSNPEGHTQRLAASTAQTDPGRLAGDSPEPETGIELFEEDDQEGGVDQNKLDQLNTEAVPDRDLVRTYLNEIGRWKLLKAEDEVRLAKEIEAGVLARQLLDGTGEGMLEENTFLHDYCIDPVTGMLHPHARQELQELVCMGQAARELMINSNLRLVVSIAKRHMGRGMQFLDVVQEGNFGLMRALEKFDYTKGYKFSTYATWWIKQSIKRGLADKARTIRLPVHVMDQMTRMASARKAFSVCNNREPSNEDLAIEMDVSVGKVIELKNHARLPIALEAPLSDDGMTEFGDLVEDSDAPQALMNAENSLLRGMFEKMLFILDERAEGVIRMRFGFDGEPLTLAEVAQVYGITRERVRQIEKNALLKMREPSRAAGLDVWSD